MTSDLIAALVAVQGFLGRVLETTKNCSAPCARAGIRLKELPSTYPPVERARAINSIVRLFDSAQNAALALQKLKSGGTQRVEVSYQQVNVGQGGRAIVTGRVGRGARRSGHGAKNDE